MAQRHRVVILGGGFGGLSAAQKLKHAPVEVPLADRRNFHLFQPLLYQVATGSLSPGEIAAPLRGVLSRQKNARVLLGEAADIEQDAKRLIHRDGTSFEYDSLIVATGSKTSYYGHDGWRTSATSLKTSEEATAIRHKILCAFEWAERAETEEEARQWLTFVIVGAGATGLELAGALAEIANETLKNDFRIINPRDARIVLIEGGARVLPPYPEDLSAKAENLVRHLGVEVMKGVMVTSVDGVGVVYKRGDASERLNAKTVLCGGGGMTNIFGLHVSGLPAWLILLFIHLMYIVQFQNRVLVFIQWGFEYLTFSRGARLITGSANSDPDRPAAWVSGRTAHSKTDPT